MSDSSHWSASYVGPPQELKAKQDLPGSRSYLRIKFRPQREPQPSSPPHETYRYWYIATRPYILILMNGAGCRSQVN